ncbi:hypothetical protein Z042_15355 [Chania multitudinisentens RB-25]|uniref:ATP-grasp domain-containing protein n=1 Tax=Chania multitudinisentens RB-25 TaxID=1441930 RepID=W0LLE9_9GAMM|nr:ATP-grasp domain-containing protein [Chania multitudinisentens]AHG22845.1 hypothetical protein Z042_15355 [Chania multitudinisentens RB-25]
MKKIGIIRIPFNIDSLRQVTDQLSFFEGDVYLIDLSNRLATVNKESLSANVKLASCDSYELDCLVELVQFLKLDNVISFPEAGLIDSARIRDELGMRGHSYEVELNSTNKYLMRQSFLRDKLTQVHSRKCNIIELYSTLLDFGFPAIVKPSNLTGGIGVQFIESKKEIINYVNRINNNPYSRDCDLVIESFISGAEYSVEGVLLDNTIHIYGITEKQTTGAPYFVEVGHAFCPNHPLIEVLVPSLKSFFKSLGMFLCPFHIEFKVVDGCIEIIEVHSRFGGDYITKLIEYSIGSKVYLDYINYLVFGIVPCIDKHQSTITTIQFSVSLGGKVESITSLEPSFLDDLLEYKVVVKEGDVLNPQVGYYERPAYFIARIENTSQIDNLRSRINHFVIELCT